MPHAKWKKAPPVMTGASRAKGGRAFAARVAGERRQRAGLARGLARLAALEEDVVFSGDPALVAAFLREREAHLRARRVLEADTLLDGRGKRRGGGRPAVWEGRLCPVPHAPDQALRRNALEKSKRLDGVRDGETR